MSHVERGSLLLIKGRVKNITTTTYSHHYHIHSSSTTHDDHPKIKISKDRTFKVVSKNSQGLFTVPPGQHPVLSRAG